MFRDQTHAEATIRQIAVADAGTPMSDAQVQLLLDKLRPGLWLAPDEDGDERPGRTRFGGAPDLPPEMPWPIRPAPFEMDRRVAEIIGDDADARSPLPYGFLAQIDLADATRHQLGELLPREGRLLFFWDGVCGLIACGPPMCRVIHDTTPVATLARPPIPTELAELDADEGPDGEPITPHVYPERPLRLVPILYLPDRDSAEFLADPDLTALAADGAHRESYGLLTSYDSGQFDLDGRGARRHRLLGNPDPEQWDPRQDALYYLRDTPEPWDAAQITATARLALDWEILLQLDLGDLAQDQFGEGTVYFMIHRDALARGDFSRVHVSYQQT